MKIKSCIAIVAASAGLHCGHELPKEIPEENIPTETKPPEAPPPEPPAPEKPNVCPDIKWVKATWSSGPVNCVNLNYDIELAINSLAGFDVATTQDIIDVLSITSIEIRQETSGGGWWYPHVISQAKDMTGLAHEIVHGLEFKWGIQDPQNPHAGWYPNQQYTDAFYNYVRKRRTL